MENAKIRMRHFEWFSNTVWETEKCFSHDIIFVFFPDISIIKGQVTIILGIIDTLKPTSQLMVKMQSFKAKVTFQQK